MTYSQEFFDLQLNYAERINSLTIKGILPALMDFTHLYKAFRILNWKFENDDPIWKRFREGFISAKNRSNYIYEFYMNRRGNQTRVSEPDDFETGCFSYHYYRPKNQVNIHFHNAENGIYGPLSSQRSEIRRQELSSLFLHVSENFPEAKTVYGHSWLYNLDSYKRLFPIEYTDTAKRDYNCFRGIGLWGQFLDKYGEVKPNLEQAFVRNFNNLTDVKDAEECFPYKTLEVEAPINHFYKFYNIN